ncbi:MAG: Y-family DNA polymerase [Comamonas testosteroni]|uniref:Y-family DNA polymerase n=1 Tax=Comamonas testosteroni TaxID=285 RepID=UPI003D0C5901
MFALIDGNNFYVSCERAFRPALQGIPVVVLSNNDGCAISRSDEAKALGVKMGQPFFQLRDLVEHKGLVCLSPNFELYGDMSDRMMSLAAGLGPTQEIYSIDESFIGELDGVRDLTRRSFAIRARILKWTGIPTCVGLAPTKTLAKLCNHVAKDSERKPGSYPAELQRVCNWAELSDQQRTDILGRTPAGEIWGVGRRISAQLAEQGVLTALDLARLPAHAARDGWSVVLERTVRELQGVSCMTLELAPAAKKQIACTRSFGHPITTLPPLIEAVSEFATRAAEKLRASGLRAGALHVFVHTSPFRPGRRFYETAVTQLQPPSSDTKALVNAAVRGLRSIYQPGYQLSKAGVMLQDLCLADVHQGDLLFQEPGRDQSKLMEAMDRVNARFGKGTVHVASTGVPEQDESGWRMRQERRTPRYTTKIDDIPIARA